jgi:hypothetical protein
VAARARRHEDRDSERDRDRLGAGRAGRIGAGQDDRLDPGAERRRCRADRVDRVGRRVARIDEQEPAAPEKGRDRPLSGHATRQPRDDPPVGLAVDHDLRRADGAEREPCRHVARRRRSDRDELLEDARRGHPHRRRPGRELVERGRRRDPAMADDLAVMERRLDAGRQVGDEEPGREAARHERGRGPLGDRGEMIGRQAQPAPGQGREHVDESGRGLSQEPVSGRQDVVRLRRRIGKEDAGFLDELADRRSVERERGHG